MIQHYFFPEAGTISGIPGTFAGVQVEVDTEINEIVKVSPLTRHPHFAPAPPDEESEVPEEEQAEQATEEVTPELLPEQVEAEPLPLEQLEVPPEQAEAVSQPEVPIDRASPADEADSHPESEGV